MSQPNERPAAPSPKARPRPEPEPDFAEEAAPKQSEFASKEAAKDITAGDFEVVP